MKLDKKTKAFLKEERKEYESRNPMTAAERNALRKWVSHGNSVFSNPCDLYDDSGRLMDFLTAARSEGAYREATPHMRENSEMLIRHLQRELFHLWMFISKEELYEEALDYLQDTVGDPLYFEMLF